MAEMKGVHVEIAEKLANLIDKQKMSQITWHKPGRIVITATLSGDALELRGQTDGVSEAYTDANCEIIRDVSMDDLYRAMGLLGRKSGCYGSEFTYESQYGGRVTISQHEHKIGSMALAGWNKNSI